MCTVSLVAQDWQHRVTGQFPGVATYVLPASAAEVAELREELEAIKKVLIAAKIYDAETGQPDCEDEDKVALFKALAKALKVDLSEVFK